MEAGTTDLHQCTKTIVGVKTSWAYPGISWEWIHVVMSPVWSPTQSSPASPTKEGDVALAMPVYFSYLLIWYRWELVELGDGHWPKQGLTRVLPAKYRRQRFKLSNWFIGSNREMKNSIKFKSFLWCGGATKLYAYLFEDWVYTWNATKIWTMRSLPSDDT